MRTGSFANVVETARLVKHFNKENIEKFKETLFKHLKCSNEQDFICTVLNQLYQHPILSDHTFSSLKSDAITIAQNQIVSKNRNLYDFVLTQYTDILSKLPSNTIDYVGSFLNKSESIEFGYLNKQLYIETQKQSYLFQRKNDPELKLDMPKLESLLSSKNNNPFHYSLPTQLRIHSEIPYERNISKAQQKETQRRVNKIAPLLKTKWFESLFSPY